MSNAIGRSNIRKDAFGPLRFNPYESTHTIMAGPRAPDLNLKHVLPKGMDLANRDPYVKLSQICLEMSPYYASQNRRVVGYVSDITRVDSVNTSSPLIATAIVEIPVVSWSTIDQPRSWNYARIVSSSPIAASTEAQSIVIGDPIAGVVVNAASKYRTANPIGRIIEIPPPEERKEERNLALYTCQ